MFLVWIVGGGLFALGCAFYDMWLSRTGRDKVAQCRREIDIHIRRFTQLK